MRAWLARFDARWFAPAPAERLAVLRVLVSGFAFAYLLARYPQLFPPEHFGEHEFVPVGVVAVLSAPLPALLAKALVVAGGALGLASTLGFRYGVSGPAFALVFLWLTSYRNSWGMIFHTETLLALHLCLLAVTPAADALSLDARARPPLAPAGAYGWPARALSAVTVVCYVLAGIAKLKLDGFGWLAGEYLRRQIAYDNLRKIELSSDYAVLGVALLPYARLFPVLACFTLLVELGAPVALLGVRASLAWCVAAWSFHVAVLATMAITFPYQLSWVAFASFFPVERVLGLRAWWQRRAATSPRDGAHPD